MFLEPFLIDASIHLPSTGLTAARANRCHVPTRDRTVSPTSSLILSPPPLSRDLFPDPLIATSPSSRPTTSPPSLLTLLTLRHRAPQPPPSARHSLLLLSLPPSFKPDQPRLSPHRPAPLATHRSFNHEDLLLPLRSLPISSIPGLLPTRQPWPPLFPLHLLSLLPSSPPRPHHRRLPRTLWSPSNPRRCQAPITGTHRLLRSSIVKQGEEVVHKFPLEKKWFFSYVKGDISLKHYITPETNSPVSTDTIVSAITDTESSDVSDQAAVLKDKSKSSAIVEEEEEEEEEEEKIKEPIEVKVVKTVHHISKQQVSPQPGKTVEQSTPGGVSVPVMMHHL